MDKEDVGDKRAGAHTHTMGHYSAMKKKRILTFCRAWMDLEGVTLKETSQAWG